MSLVVLRFVREVEPTPGLVTLRFGEAAEALSLGPLEGDISWSFEGDLTEDTGPTLEGVVSWEADIFLSHFVNIDVEGEFLWSLHKAELRQPGAWFMLGSFGFETELRLNQFGTAELSLDATVETAGECRLTLPLALAQTAVVEFTAELQLTATEVTPLVLFGTVVWGMPWAELSLSVEFRIEGSFAIHADLLLGPALRWSDCPPPYTEMFPCEPTFGQEGEFDYIHAGETQAFLTRVGLAPALQVEKTGVYSFIVINAAVTPLSTPWEECPLPIVDAWSICDTSPYRS